MPGSEPLRLAVIGTDTGVGKTRVVGLLVRGLRRAGRQVWLHKPMACGGWAAGQAEDGRALAALAGDGQPPATICPLQYPEAASPHLAAAAAGGGATLGALAAAIAPLAGPGHDLVVEGIGGLLVPLTAARETVCDLLVRARLPVVVVTRPHLGTLNHTALTVAHARRAGLVVLGLVVNAHQPVGDDLATRSAPAELAALCAAPVLACLPWGCGPEVEAALAAALLGATSAEPPRG
jgi:dethiobiotin synthetase